MYEYLSVIGKTLPSFSVFKSIPFDENQSKVSHGPNLADKGPKSSLEPRGYPCVVCVQYNNYVRDVSTISEFMIIISKTLYREEYSVSLAHDFKIKKCLTMQIIQYSKKRQEKNRKDKNIIEKKKKGKFISSSKCQRELTFAISVGPFIGLCITLHRPPPVII